MKKVKEFLNSWGMLIMVPMMIIVFFKGCGTSSTVSDLEEDNAALTEQVAAQDSTIKQLEETIKNRVPTKKEVRDEMERVMLDFLIYEDELDKKKITISQIKDKIESND